MEYKVIERYGKYYYQDKEGRIYGGRIGFNYIVGFDAAGEFVDGKAWFMVKREYIDRDRPVPELVTKEEYYVVNEGLRCVMWGQEAKEYAEQRRTQPTFPKTNLTVRCDESGYFFVNEKGEELFDERFAHAEIAKSGVLTVGRKQGDKILNYVINKKGEIIAGPYSSLSMADRKGAIKKDAGNNSNNAEYIEFAVDEKGRCDDYEVALELVKRDIRFLFKLSDRVYREYARKYELFSMKNKARYMNLAITESLAKMISEKVEEGVTSIIDKLKNVAAPKKASVAEAAAVTKAIERFKETGNSRKIRELFQERVRDATKEQKDFNKQEKEGREYLYSGALDKELQEQEGKQKKEMQKQAKKQKKEMQKQAKKQKKEMQKQADEQEKERKKQASKQEKAMLKQANEQEEEMHKQAKKLEEEMRKLAEELENISKESFDYYNNKD